MPARAEAQRGAHRKCAVEDRTDAYSRWTGVAVDPPTGDSTTATS